VRLPGRLFIFLDRAAKYHRVQVFIHGNNTDTPIIRSLPPW